MTTEFTCIRCGNIKSEIEFSPLEFKEGIICKDCCVGKNYEADLQTYSSPEFWPEREIYKGIKSRCFCKTNPAYQWYGGRNISMCQRWQDSFIHFLYDLGPRPSPKHSVERINVNGDYCPENCKWGTRKEQSRNTTRTIFVEIDGETIDLMSLSEKHHISYKRILSRYTRGDRGIDLLRDKKEPVRFFHKGKHRTIKEIADMEGIDKGTLNNRLITYGIPLQEAISSKNMIERIRKSYEAKRNVINFRGRNITVKELSDLTGIEISTLHRRIRSGRPDEDLLKPSLALQWHSYNGKMYNALELADISGFSKTTIWKRLREGMSVKETVETPLVRRTRKKTSELLDLEINDR